MRNKNVGFNQTTASITTAASTVLTANSQREYLLIQNNGAGTIYINFSGAATTANGIKVDAEEAYEPFMVPTNEVSIIGDAAADVVIVEGSAKPTVTDN